MSEGFRKEGSKLLARLGRRKILVDPAFQLTVTGYFAGIALIAITVVFWIVHLLFSDFMNLLRMNPGLLQPSSVAYLVSLQSRTLALLAVGSITVFSIVTIGGIVISFRVAGPIHRLRKHMRELTEGKKESRVTIRKRDFFKGLADDYNALIERFR